MNGNDFFGIPIYSIIMAVCFVSAIVVHEVAHGFVANRLGDPTAKSQGRLSLNPIKHIDPFGTVILPLILMLAGGPVFGYAKPVPYNPSYFKNLRMGELMTGLAGPAANLIMGLIGALVANLVIGLGFAPSSAASWVIIACYYFAMINFCLMFFNLLPIPPLDGSSIIALFLSDKALRQYYSIQRYALPVLMILLIVVPYILHISPIGIYIDATAGNLTRLLFPM
ncbi:MAG: site-2 protease family protein [Coriobacteriales bacterium]|jgi:Zn-dependent protease|nr:site-2 protease family protein [Coriobacteriales bacterium]